MRLVAQEKESDCGPAAVATLCGVSLQKASSYIYERRGRKGVTSSGCLIEAIEHFHRRPLEAKCRALGERKLYDLEHDALLGCFLLVPLTRATIRPDSIYRWKNSRHWAVWDHKQKTILDP